MDGALLNDFRNYAMNHLGISSMQLYYWNQLQENIYSNKMLAMPSSPKASMTPYIIEEMEKRGVQMDIFSRLMMDRIIFLGTGIDDYVANVIQAQLLFLESTDPKSDVQIYINSPGGVVYSGLGIYDTMQYIKPDVSTLCIGQAASMGSFLLAAGTKGKRFSLPNSRIMVHQPSAGFQGQATDIEIHANEVLSLKKRLNEIYSKHTNKSVDEIKPALERDNFMTPENAKDFGLIDKVVVKRQ